MSILHSRNTRNILTRISSQSRKTWEYVFAEGSRWSWSLLLLGITCERRVHPCLDARFYSKFGQREEIDIFGHHKDVTQWHALLSQFKLRGGKIVAVRFMRFVKVAGYSLYLTPVAYLHTKCFIAMSEEAIKRCKICLTFTIDRRSEDTVFLQCLVFR